MVLSALEATRDIVIIVWGILTIVTFAFFLAFLFVLWRGIMGLMKDIKAINAEDIRPMLAVARESANNVTGTTRFVSDTVATPIMRVYGIVAYVRRFIGVFTGLTRRGGRKQEPERPRR